MVEGWSRDGRGMVEGLSKASTESHFLCFYCPFLIFFRRFIMFSWQWIATTPFAESEGWSRDCRGPLRIVTFALFCALFFGFCWIPTFLAFFLEFTFFLRVFFIASWFFKVFRVFLFSSALFSSFSLNFVAFAQILLFSACFPRFLFVLIDFFFFVDFLFVFSNVCPFCWFFLIACWFWLFSVAFACLCVFTQ